MLRYHLFFIDLFWYPLILIILILTCVICLELIRTFNLCLFMFPQYAQWLWNRSTYVLMHLFFITLASWHALARYMVTVCWLEYGWSGGQVSFHFRKAFLFSCKQSMFHCLYCVRIPHCQGEMIIKNNILCKSCYFHLASIVCRHFLSRYLVFAGALFAVEMSWVSCSSYLYWRKIL